MLRRLCTAASALSLLLCAASAGLWATSYRRDCVVKRVAWPRSYFGLRCVGGRGLAWWVAQPMTDRPPGWHVSVHPPEPLSMWNSGANSAAAAAADPLYRQFTGAGAWRFAGFGVARWGGTAADGLPYRDVSVIVPLWALPVAVGCLPLLAAFAWLHRRRRAGLACHGLCTTCGYDLRASTDRCPECGTPIPSGAKT